MRYSPFDWSGTLPRRPYWIGLIFYLAANLALPTLPQNTGIPVWSALLVLSILQLWFAAFVVRRLHDLGRSGYWGLLVVVPFIGLVLLLVLGLRRGKATPPDSWPYHPSHRIGQGLLVAVILLALSRIVWAPYTIPSGNMKPTLLVGDFVVAIATAPNKIKRGDVVVFKHPATGSDFTKRVIGLPGETVQLRDGVVYINATPVPQTPLEPFVESLTRQGPFERVPRCANAPVGIGKQCLKEQWQETLPEGRRYRILNIGNTHVDTTGLFTVPDGHLFVLGDNRDNSVDSRMPLAVRGVGFVPIENVTHRAAAVLFSAAGTVMADLRRWRWDRLFTAVQ